MLDTRFILYLEIKMNVINELQSLQDVKYRDFQSKLIPTIDKSTIIGVRMPDLRKLAKKIDEKQA